MATLEERLQELERALSIMKSEHISTINQLGERVDILQQQIGEQKRRISDQGQAMHQRFDTLEKALSQQFAVINQSLSRIEQQAKQQTDEIKAKFDISDHFAGRTWGLAQEQERDIREVKISLGAIDGRFTSLERQSESQNKKLDQALQMLVTLTNKTDS